MTACAQSVIVPFLYSFPMHSKPPPLKDIIVPGLSIPLLYIIMLES